MYENIKKCLKSLKEGKIIIIVDDEDRENEGDFVFAAEFSTPEKINFLIKYGRGLVCTPITEKIAKKLDLPLMVQENTSICKTAFTVSIDAKEGITTGISAKDRAITIQKLSSENCRAEDFCKPGHIFPLIANSQGLLARRGQTEASVNMLQLLDMKPIAVICEIINDDGTMARGEQLEKIKQQHKIEMLKIEELVSYIKHEKLEYKILNQ